MQKTINCNGILISLEKPKVMGILNLTPDSFYDGGKFLEIKNVLIQVEQMLQEGADFIDVGAISTRPGATLINVSEEEKRLLPVLKELVNEFPNTIFSIDTFRAEIAKKAIENGASIINDISAGRLDDKMFETVAKLKCPYILMHSRGTLETVHFTTKYEHLITDIIKEIQAKVDELIALNVSDIIIDPGFGFSKSIAENFSLLNELDVLNKILELPILAGLSRKSMIWKTLEIDAENALNGTTALNMIALEKGAKILRVHDVKAAKETVKLFNALHF